MAASILYLRNGRYYADLRGYGGKQEAMIPPGAGRATQDRQVAQKLLAERLQGLRDEKRRRDQGYLEGRATDATLASFAAEHLVKKARGGRATTDWLAMHELILKRAIAFFGAGRPLELVTLADVEAWAAHLQASPIVSRRKLKDGEAPPPPRYRSPGTVRHHLNVLSNLFRRAIAERAVPVGYNPVQAMLEKPRGIRREASWLEVPDAALLLEAARTLPRSTKGGGQSPYGYALVATFLLTGGREAEVLGLEISDVSFERQTVTFRENAWRRLKTDTSARVVPLWPQLAEILRAYLNQRIVEEVAGKRAPSPLLFPSDRGGMLVDVRKYLDRVGQRGGWRKGEIRSKMFRHTYCAARLQTLDQGAPVSVYTVRRELGHGSTKMVEEVYSHLGELRHRAEVVEYRVEQHAVRLAERLASLQPQGIPGECSGE